MSPQNNLFPYLKQLGHLFKGVQNGNPNVTICGMFFGLILLAMMLLAKSSNSCFAQPTTQAQERSNLNVTVTNEQHLDSQQQSQSDWRNGGKKTPSYETYHK